MEEEQLPDLWSRSQLGRAGGGMPVRMRHHTAHHTAPEPCTSPSPPSPPTTQVAATEEGWGRRHGKSGTGDSRKTGGRDYAQKLSLQGWALNLYMGDWAARCALASGRWLLFVQQLCLTPYAQRFVYNTGENMFQNHTCLGKIQSSSTHNLLQTPLFPSYAPTYFHEVLPAATHSVTLQWDLSQQACEPRHHQPQCAKGVFMVPTCLPSWIFWGWIFITFSFCLEEVS